ASAAGFLADLQTTLWRGGGCRSACTRCPGGCGCHRSLGVGEEHLGDSGTDLDHDLALGCILADRTRAWIDSDVRDKVATRNHLLDGDLCVQRELPGQDTIASGDAVAGSADFD